MNSNTWIDVIDSLIMANLIISILTMIVKYIAGRNVDTILVVALLMIVFWAILLIIRKILIKLI
jgi:hypothetical protein